MTAQYRYLRDIPAFFEDFERQNDRFENFVDVSEVNQVSGSVRVRLTRLWSADYRLVYSFDLSDLILQRGTVRYRSRCDCWGIGVAISDTRDRGVQFNIVYELVGLGKRRGSSSNFLGSLVDGI